MGEGDVDELADEGDVVVESADVGICGLHGLADGQHASLG